MGEVLNSYPCDVDMIDCDHDLQELCTTWDTEQREIMLESAKQCTERENCETCLFSWQCKGNAEDPRTFCCPRVKKCIDTTDEGMRLEKYGCAGGIACPSMCSERPSQHPRYPF